MISFQGYLFSSAEKIIGIEIDVNFCQLQQRMIEKYNMTDRINVSCDEQCLHLIKIRFRTASVV